ncbi:hypothetical protein SNOG_15293 [Parastagonospora nodorum SN15]|uniref:Uncharacterized protein n=1 Tax=Phaeosphaeria nodorum (strain SN15 / ATCC MYA-4574 / FGSC 10173) TaxID=321614 RepID=Q0TYL8_PHANO|nr:hypothetical protein SNOG_15293 [Parastagonospora nodorum SN15]EAT77226.1 hypothetical protein SNOG_15293 [Parastagonospora nodorum SN15]
MAKPNGGAGCESAQHPAPTTAGAQIAHNTLSS